MRVAIIALFLAFVCMCDAQATRKPTSDNRCCIPDGFTMNWNEVRLRLSTRSGERRLRKNETIVATMAQDTGLGLSYLRLEETHASGNKEIYEHITRTETFGLIYTYTKNYREDCYVRQYVTDHPEDLRCVTALQGDYGAASGVEKYKIDEEKSGWLQTFTRASGPNPASARFIYSFNGTKANGCQPVELQEQSTSGSASTNSTVYYQPFRQATAEDWQEFIGAPLRKLCRTTPIPLRSTSTTSDGDSEGVSEGVSDGASDGVSE